jgi:hypothetical protein
MRIAPTCGGPLVCPHRELHGQASNERALCAQRAREQFGEIGCLLVALDRREDQLDRPLGGQALGLQRVGEAKAADDEIRPSGATAVELRVDVLALDDVGALGQQRQSRGPMHAGRLR